MCVFHEQEIIGKSNVVDCDRYLVKILIILPCEV